MKAGTKPDAGLVGMMIASGMMTVDVAREMTPDFDKPAGARCPHQRHGKGCAIYDRRPFGCRYWNCRWLVNDDAADLPRPDRSHYVIDVSPDYVTLEEDGAEKHLPVVQVWLDPGYPDAHRDPALRAWIDRRGRDGYAALIRLSNREGFVLFPPSLTGAGWVEKRSNRAAGPEHSLADKIAVLGDVDVVIR